MKVYTVVDGAYEGNVVLGVTSTLDLAFAVVADRHFAPGSEWIHSPGDQHLEPSWTRKLDAGVGTSIDIEEFELDGR